MRMRRAVVVLCALTLVGAVPNLRVCAAVTAACHATRPRPCLAAVVTRPSRKAKKMKFHDIARNETEGNEYFAGGIDDQGHGSGTVLLYPEDEYANSTDASNTTVEAEAERELAEKFVGTARSLD